MEGLNNTTGNWTVFIFCDNEDPLYPTYTDNPIYNYDYSEEVGMYHFYQGNRMFFRVYLCGAVLSYLTFIFSVIIFTLLCSREFTSPVIILIQGLAISDACTALFVYGGEPLFIGNYKDWTLWDFTYKTPWNHVTLLFPYCLIYYICVQLADCFHFVSALLTAAIGILKVLAIRFPLWTSLTLTKRKSLTLCVLMFLLSLLIYVPRILSTDLLKQPNAHKPICQARIQNRILATYSVLGNSLLMACALTIICFVMIFCSIYMSYKLANNTFTGRHTNTHTYTRRSVILVLVVLVVFLVTEIPRIVLYGITFAYITEIGNLKHLNGKSLPEYSSDLLYLPMEAISYHFKLMTCLDFKIFIEIFKFFTLVGCLSNFIIYLVIGQNIRRVLITKLIWRSVCSETEQPNSSARELMELNHM